MTEPTTLPDRTTRTKADAPRDSFEEYFSEQLAGNREYLRRLVMEMNRREGGDD